ncbi:vitamin K epoxide reductase family protein [Pseudonocardia acaciae]|uniref:vitamin K epoxide reductase family protein n=1 Tax=Pseudonocardia acaciae TaxID=551276 RepID=UPI000564152F|nr:vitamin K epoxide reductase family protein [Pseudonocardia acaciae]
MTSPRRIDIPSADRELAGPGGGRLAWIWVAGGGIGLAAAFALTLEELATLAHPGRVPACDLSPIVSCGSVMGSSQGAAFGFPNPLIGVAAFAVVVSVGVALLSGFRPPRLFWLGMQLGTTLGVGFVHWLIHSSLYRLGALCPYCMVVWAVTIPIFWYTTLHNVVHGHLPVGHRRVVQGLARYHSLVLAIWYLVLVVLILLAFWPYWAAVR